MSASEDTISVSGERVDTQPPGQRGVAMMFQSYALYPHRTVAQSMSFDQKNINVDKQKISRRVAVAAETLEMSICWIANRRNCPADNASVSP